MKKIFTLFAILVCLFQIDKTYASHAAAMDISYQCLGNNQYRFTVTFYRDCSGITPTTSQTLAISSANCNFNTTISLPKVSSTVGTDIIAHLAGLCPGLNSQCNNGIYQGYERYVYSGTYTFPQQCSDWIIGASVSSRNDSITNLVSPGITDLYVETHLNNLNGLCDNSPTFSNLPIVYACAGQTFNYNHAAVDADGDSLVYHLVNPLSDLNTPIIYDSASFNPNYPLSTATGTFGFDTLTGQMTFIPNSNQIAVVSVLISEYRNNVLVGTTYRDLQIVVNQCSNIIPSIPNGITNMTGGTQINNTTLEVCPGNTVSFTLMGSDINATDSLFYRSNINTVLPTATIVDTGIIPVTRFITWSPLLSDTGIHTFSVTISDNACPISGQQSYSYSIYVPKAVSAGPDIYECRTTTGIDTVQLQAGGAPYYHWITIPPNAATFNNDDIANPLALITATTTFVVIGDTNTTCIHSDTVVVFLVPAVTVSATFSDDSICVGTSVNLSSSASGGTGNFTFSWTSIPSGFSSAQQNTTASPLASTTYFITASESGCIATDSVSIIVNPLPDPTISANSAICIHINTLVSGVAMNGNIYNWNFDNAVINSGSGAGPYSVRWDVAGNKIIGLRVTDPLGCTDSSTASINVNPQPVVFFSVDPVAGCSPLTVEFNNTSSNTTAWVWDFGDNTFSNDSTPTHVYTTGTYDVTLAVTDIHGCMDTLKADSLIHVVPVPIADFSTDASDTTTYDIVQANFTFTNLSQFADHYLWMFGDGTTSTDQNPTHSYTGVGTYFVTLISYNAYCSDTLRFGPIVVVSYNTLYFPNAFTPNVDGSNDYFHELGHKGIVSLSYQVYNRWGQLVYETNNADGKWDGTFKGNPAEVGVYIYYAKATMINKSIIEAKGNISLLR